MYKRLKEYWKEINEDFKAGLFFLSLTIFGILDIIIFEKMGWKILYFFFTLIIGIFSLLFFKDYLKYIKSNKLRKEK